jgi:hypothetical protein
MMAEQNIYQFYKCPKCARYYPLSRKYCDCHERLENIVYWSETAVELGAARYNLETSKINCKDCGMGCKICASFAMLRRNKQGFGGLDCLFRAGSVRCTCCQTLMREDPMGFDMVSVVNKIREQFKNNMPPPELSEEKRWYEDDYEG